jgi:8-oxo-dGTP pyrophosphatase MutT (NUDIX family)
VQAIVVDAEHRALLIPQTRTSGWTLPGGLVEANEGTEASLARLLLEQAGIRLSARASLHGIYVDHDVTPDFHTVLYVVRSWHKVSGPEPAFFERATLPPAMEATARSRLLEVLSRSPSPAAKQRPTT